MSLIKKELTEKNGFVIEFSVDKETYQKAEMAAYKKNVKSMNIPGFRKGKAPIHVIKTMYGKDIFFEDAINACIPEAFGAAVKEAELDVVGAPKFDLVSMDGDVVLKAEGFVKPEVGIDGYKGIEVEKNIAEVTDADVEAELDKVRDRNARFIQESDKAIENGDTVTIDFEGFIDGTAFDGGKGENHELKIGSGSFIPGFEDQIIGHKVGESFDVNVTFPEEYHAKELASKAATFKCTVKSLKELPVADDEFAKDVSEFDTIAEYKNDLKAGLVKKNESAADREMENALAEKLMDLLVAEIPEPMFVEETENYLRDYDTRLRQSGLDLKTYMKYTGMTLDQLREQMRPQAEKQVKIRLALEKIAALEAIEIGEDDINAEYERIANTYSVKVEDVKNMIASEDLTKDLKVSKAMELVKANAKIVKPAAKTTKARSTKAKTAAKAEGATEEKAEAKKPATKTRAKAKAKTEEK